MLIDRTFSDITSSWIGDFESSKSSQKSRKEEYPDTDFFDLITVKSMDRHFRTIEMYRASFPRYRHTKGFDNRKKCEDISDFWNIMQSKCLKKESTRNKWKCCVFRSRDFYCSAEGLRSGDFKHGHMIEDNFFILGK